MEGITKRAVGVVLLLCLIGAAYRWAFAQAGPSLRSAPPCGSTSTFTTASFTGEDVHVPQLERPSLVQAQAILFQVARHVMRNPQLFSLEMRFDQEFDFLRRGPSTSGFSMVASYTIQCDQSQYLKIYRFLDDSGYPRNSAEVGVTPFVPPSRCGGNLPAFPGPASSPVLPAEPWSKHPPLQGWTVDLPQLWTIAKRHEALFANGVEQCLFTTVARLREIDKVKCGNWTVYNSPFWNGVIPSNPPTKRLVSEQDRRAVIELIERGIAVSQPGSAYKNKNCKKGHYLIIDAHSGLEIDTGTYFSCLSSPA